MPETTIVTRQIADGAITNAKVKSDAAIATSKLADSANFILRGGSVAMTGNLDLGNQKVVNLQTPSASGDGATKGYVDGLIAGLNALFDSKGSVRAATTANGTLATAFENGDAIDGVTLATGDRILLKNQTAPAENGIYVVAASGAPVRATDMDAWTEIPGAWVVVEEGTANADKIFLSTANQGGTLETTAITFTDITPSAGGLTSSNFVDNEVPSGTIDGANVTFTLANTPTAGTVHLYLNGIRLFVGAGNDFTISSATITMTTAPLTGERLVADYRK